MASRCLALLLALALVGCGDDSTDPGTDAGGGGTDAGDTIMDAGGGGTDAGDGTTDAGDGTTDAGDGTTDAGDGATDAGDGTTDAGDGPSDAGMTMCTGKVGEVCNDTNPCDAPAEGCVGMDDSGNGVCAPAGPICGGFAGATCPTSAPHCLNFSPSTAAGHCVTDAELTCVCTPAGRMRFRSLCGPMP